MNVQPKSSREKSSATQPTTAADSPAKHADTPLATEKITLRESSDGPRAVTRQFPGPRNADVALRVAVERRAHADLIAHAKESLDAEVCGVLVGQVCEDPEGPFVHVEASIRGAQATQASTHV